MENPRSISTERGKNVHGGCLRATGRARRELADRGWAGGRGASYSERQGLAVLAEEGVLDPTPLRGFAEYLEPFGLEVVR